MSNQEQPRPPFPPFSEESAGKKVKAAQDAWNTKYGSHLHEIAVQFWYEWHDESGQWWRTYGLEDWTFADNGLMRKRQMSGNDVKISDEERWFKDGVDVNSVDISEKHW
ncbi:hypothetical protein SAPIO_CDS9936 [Scedosporium apiospermum]|uniref:DUF1348-domain-containing protein n=1 Tax=Pseudallescheria apiosperma TaxID=563466 RepID=A0A084FW02_PSEDA|nr:uncharacterized protein SAPIO_CDS9936 [Scedosporium apiospermum]KEZ39264.1 hypothetical protein SAPIO_CDS9936 [Scedosporium apiospermum]